MLPDTILRLPAVKAATGLSRSSIYDRISKGTFPAPVSLGGKAVGWPASEVGVWIQKKIAEGRVIDVATATTTRLKCRPMGNSKS